MSGDIATPLAERQGWTGTIDAVVVSCVWVGRRLAIADGEGRIGWIDPAAPRVEMQAAHAGAVLCAAADATALITGGDDGQLMRHISPDASVQLARLPGRWIEHLLLSPPLNLGAASAGKDLIIFDVRSGETIRQFPHPSSIGGLALDPKGRRIAASYYGGVNLWWLGIDGGNPRCLEWKGSHLATTWSPNGRFVITAMQEHTLHGWRIDDEMHMRMSGYTAKTRAFAWSQKGRWLASAGAPQVVCWPFTGSDGPMGKAPLHRGDHGAVPDTDGTGVLVTQLAFHPKEDVLAAGYDDGCVELIHFADGRTLTVLAPGEGAVTTMAWSGDGRVLACGSEGGRVAVIPVSPARH